MSKKVDATDEQVPYAELVIRGGDSRPIVISSLKAVGRVDISPGTSADADEARLWCEMLVQVLTSVSVVRRLKEGRKIVDEIGKPSADDIPF